MDQVSPSKRGRPFGAGRPGAPCISACEPRSVSRIARSQEEKSSELSRVVAKAIEKAWVRKARSNNLRSSRMHVVRLALTASDHSAPCGRTEYFRWRALR